MAFYLIYSGTIILLALIGMHQPIMIFKTRTNQYKVDIPWLVMILSMIVVLGLRDVATADTLAYSRGFSLMQSGDYNSSYFSYNILYILINKLAISIGGNVHTVYLICACISIIFLALGLEKIDCNKYLYLALFLLTFQFYDQFNIIRQGVAMSISFFALNAFLLEKKNFKIYVAFIIIAPLFHLSAIVMIPVYFIVQRKIPFSVMLATIAGVFFLSSFISRLPIIHSIFKSIWTEIYSSQFDYALITVSEVVIAMVIIAFRKKIAYNETDNIILNLTFLFPLFRMGAANFFILHRISKYFIYYYILALLMSPRIAKKEHNYIIYIFVFAFYILWFFFYIRGYESFHHYRMIDLFSALGR